MKRAIKGIALLSFFMFHLILTVWGYYDGIRTMIQVGSITTIIKGILIANTLLYILFRLIDKFEERWF